MIPIPLSIEKCTILCPFSAPPFSHLTSCTPTKCNLYFSHSLATAFSMPALQRQLPFLVPSVMSIFRCLSLATESVLVRRSLQHFVRNQTFFGGRLLIPPPNPQAVRPPPFGCPRLLIQHIRSYPPYLQTVSSIRNWGRAVPWWQGTHLIWLYFTKHRNK
jgi:hypothetical protein